MKNVGSISWRLILIVGSIWILQATFSTFNTGLIQQYSGNTPRWLAIAIYSYADAFGWCLMTVVMYWVIQRLSVLRWSITRLIVAHLVLAIAIASIQRLIGIVLSYNLIYFTEAVDLSLLRWSNFFGMNYIRYVANGLVTYFVIVGILYGYSYYVRSRQYLLQKAELETQLAKARIENLKFQFQPHFLFNSLQSVSTLMHRDLKSADQALGDLGDLLRYSIKTIDTEKIRLGDELMYLQKYIHLQQTRFGDKLTSHIDFDESLLDAKVPSFLLQPIVENSIKHGLEATGNAVQIHIRIVRDQYRLQFICRDFNKPNDEATTSHSGTGLSNLQLRLNNLYEANAQVTTQALEDGFETIISIPYTSYNA